MSDHRTRTLVTGFLEFEGFEVNPSALLAQSCGRPFELLKVSYDAVDSFIETLDPDRFDRLLLLGVAGKSSRMRTEMVARNVVGARLDVVGAATAGAIDPTGPSSISGTLWQFNQETSRRRPSDDAGDYLCNYIYYRALQKLNGQHKRVGFLHVPPLDRMPLEEQQHELAEILRLIE